MSDGAELCRGLLRKARSDRLAMDASFAAQALDAACFHAQQLAEKALKSFLAYQGVVFPHTHNLTKLVEICAGAEPGFRALLPIVAPLTPYAVELRYDDSFWPSQKAAEEASSLAKEVHQFVLDRLPADFRRGAE